MIFCILRIPDDEEREPYTIFINSDRLNIKNKHQAHFRTILHEALEQKTTYLTGGSDLMGDNEEHRKAIENSYVNLPSIVHYSLSLYD